jgi:DNA replication protein DnaC
VARKPFSPAARTPLDNAESGTLKGQLVKLGLDSIAEHFEAEADRAAKSETTYTAYLARLVEFELADKADRSINARIARARFPMLRTLEEYDFSQPGLPAARVRELANLALSGLRDKHPAHRWAGVGKTHLAIGLSLKVCAARRSVLFTYAPDLLDQLVAVEVSHTLGRLLAQLRRLDLLVVDELGYLPMDGRRATLFFQLVAARYSRGSPAA